MLPLKKLELSPSLIDKFLNDRGFTGFYYDLHLGESVWGKAEFVKPIDFFKLISLDHFLFWFLFENFWLFTKVVFSFSR